MIDKDKILYVDDELGNLSIFKALFGRHYDLFTAKSGFLALKILEKHPIKMIITDQRMPKMTGIEFLNKVKLKWPEINSVLLTGYAEIDIVKSAVNDLNIFRYVNKPFDHREMKSIIDLALELYNAKVEKDATNILIQESEEKYRGIFETITDVFTRIGNDGLVKLVSPSIYQLTGYKSEDLIGKKAINFYANQDDRTELIKKVTEKGYYNNFETKIFAKDDRIIPVLVSAKIYRDKDGTPLGIDSLTRDMAEFKRQQKKLIETESKMSLLFETSMDAIISVDSNQKIIMANRATGTMFGYNTEELIGKPLDILIPKENRKKHPKKVNTFTRSEKSAMRMGSLNSIIYGLTSSGVKIPIETSISKQIINNKYFYSAFIRDVSEKVLTAEKIKESEAKFRSFTELSKVAIFVIIDKKFYYTNNEAEEISGYTKETLFEMNFTEIIHPDYIPLVSKNYNMLLDGQTSKTRYDIKIITKGGQIIDLDINIANIDVDNKAAMLISAIDITAKNEMTFQIQKAIGLLESKNKELEQFAYIASHDLQEPLSTVGSFVDLLNQEYKDKLDANANVYLDFIIQSTKRMKALITGLLEFSRIGRERTLEKVDCNEILASVKEDLQASINKKNAVIKSEKLPNLYAYSSEIKQLFQNLISNALKYSKQNVPPIINISAKKENDVWLFKVKDNGIGIDEKFRETIFIIFQRLHNNDDYAGTGIGLAYCRKIIELHGGKIWVESNIDEGSIFYFTIKAVKK